LEKEEREGRRKTCKRGGVFESLLLAVEERNGAQESQTLIVSLFEKEKALLRVIEYSRAAILRGAIKCRWKRKKIGSAQGENRAAEGRLNKHEDGVYPNSCDDNAGEGPDFLSGRSEEITGYGLEPCVDRTVRGYIPRALKPGR